MSRSDAAGIETLFREFVDYLRSIGDKSEYRIGAQQYLTDRFGSDPVFRGLVAEDESGLIGMSFSPEVTMVIMSVSSWLVSTCNKRPEATVLA